ncbi:MAG: UDP-N-acetylmuramoyl-L-alanyl-D-glutamate--2,6-diaminopimelate ligase, partial [Selenomonadaceae bacterium]|nr:UDP-N-acetylmuramoyl-L-alanyl-D-glutamate--2,6-diaminopimelate ligase [Selenomonadaceae bacterium]
MKTIGELAALVKGAEVIGSRDAAITGIERDSRKVGKGGLFVCIPGIHVDGHDFIPQVAGQGAAA